MLTTYTAAPDIDVLTSNVPIPGFGLVPVNAFVLKGAEPMLVDTGVSLQRDAFMETLRTVIDPAELRWLWLTHTDFDHIGGLTQLLAENPHLKVVTNFLGVGIMSLAAPLPLDRVHLVNPGETITLGSRIVTALRPPVFDNPSTMGFYDRTTGVLVSSDCFGALLQDVPQSATELREQDLRDGQVLWATIDSPWLHRVDRQGFAADLAQVQALEPTVVLSSHLPAAPGTMLPKFLEHLSAAPGAQPFVGPNQAALEQMLKGMTASA